MQIENDIENYLIRESKRYGLMCLKFTSPGLAGVPDRILIAPTGQLIFVEMKRPGGRPRKLQLKIFEKLRGFGQTVKIVSTKAEVDQLMTGGFDK